MHQRRAALGSIESVPDLLASIDGSKRYDLFDKDGI